MNLMPAKIGAEPKKVAVVLVLLAVAAYFYSLFLHLESQFRRIGCSVAIHCAHSREHSASRRRRSESRVAGEPIFRTRFGGQ
jgi:hypothetical protein